MEKIVQSPLLKRKKISLDVNEEFLKSIDELAKLTKTSRSTTIEAIMGKGYPALIDQLKISWQVLLSGGNLNKEKEKNVKKLLKELKKFTKEIELQKNFF